MISMTMIGVIEEVTDGEDHTEDIVVVVGHTGEGLTDDGLALATTTTIFGTIKLPQNLNIKRSKNYSY